MLGRREAPASGGTYRKRLTWSAAASPLVQEGTRTAWMLCSFMGIWTEMVFSGKSEEAAIGLATGGAGALGEVVRGEVQGVGRGVPSGKAAAGPAAVPRAKQGTWCW